MAYFLMKNFAAPKLTMLHARGTQVAEHLRDVFVGD
jgi:hypothetical protein